MPELKLTDLTESNVSAPGGMGQISNILKEGKGLLEMLAKLQGKNIGQAAEVIKPGMAANEQKGLSGILDIMKQLGLTEIPISKLLEQIAPYSISQIQELGGNFLANKPELPESWKDVRTQK